MKKSISVLLSIIMVMCSVSSLAFSQYNSLDVLNGACDYIYQTVENPTISSIGGEWAVIGLSRSDYSSDSFYECYYQNVCDYIQNLNSEVLSKNKSTENSRVIIALTSIGKNPRDVLGFNLLRPLSDMKYVTRQGINGAIYALIAFDCGKYSIPKTESGIQTTRDGLLSEILSKQLSDGGWGLSSSSDIDITAMAIQALSPYYLTDDNVKESIDSAIDYLSQNQLDNGGFVSYGAENSESCSQVLTAICTLGIYDDARLIKNDCTVLDALLNFYDNQTGGFCHMIGDGVNAMATEQAVYALASYKRAQSSSSSLYDMTDSLPLSTTVCVEINSEYYDIQLEDISTESVTMTELLNYLIKSEYIPDGVCDYTYTINGETLDNSTMIFYGDFITIAYEKEEKSSDLQNAPTKNTLYFSDISDLISKDKISTLAKMNIIHGINGKQFMPYSTMTRAEFSTIIVNALKIDLPISYSFSDVSESDWFYPYISSAKQSGIINGIFDTEFNPYGTITHEEAYTIILRASQYLNVYKKGAQSTISTLEDYDLISDWAYDAVDFCLDSKLINSNKIEPLENAKRHEVAEIIYNLLQLANQINTEE